MQIRDRIRGALIGVAYGDAFGMPTEMWPRKKIRATFGYVEEFLPGHPDSLISRKLVRGEVTDDTINSVMVVRMLAANHGRVDARLFLSQLEQWIATSEKSSAVVGPSTARAMELLKQGVPMEETGKRGTTNGGAMKILPVGLANALWDEDLTALVEEVTRLCMPTHYTACAISAASAIAAGASCAARGEQDMTVLLDRMKEAADLGEQKGCDWGAPSVSARIDMGLALTKQKDKEACLDALYRLVGTGVSSVESVPVAAVLFALAGGEVRECAKLAANIGGDTDTMGAMACGICGAYQGASVFRKDEVALLEQVNGIDFDELTDSLIEACR